jgi:hypothetical protein
MNVSLSPSLITMLILAGLLVLYFLPSLVAGGRRHPQTQAITVLNLLLGFTILGWVGALVWACMNCQPIWPAEAYAFTEHTTCDDPESFAHDPSMRHHGRVPAALSPAERRMLVEVER